MVRLCVVKSQWHKSMLLWLTTDGKKKPRWLSGAVQRLLHRHRPIPRPGCVYEWSGLLRSKGIEFGTWCKKFDASE